MNVRRYMGSGSEGFAVMSRDEVRRFDSWAISAMQVPGVVLMENAGRGCAEVILERLGEDRDARVCIFCGTGNNGGDGYVIARHLVNNAIAVRVLICGDAGRIKGDVRVLICGDAGRIKGDALVNLKIIERMNLSIDSFDLSMDRLPRRVCDVTADCKMIVDAIFGTGLKGELRDEYVGLISCTSG